jgi:hypothetical protein
MQKYNKIMSVFNGTIIKLEKLAEKDSALAAVKTELAAKLMKEAEDAELEMNKAMSMAQKLNEFLEV